MSTVRTDPYFYFSICLSAGGSEIVNGDERDIAAKICAMAAERGIEVWIAYDGMKVRI